jgi:hypothetical protein
VADEDILFTDASEGVLAVMATLPGLIVIAQESERGIAGSRGKREWWATRRGCTSSAPFLYLD